MTSGGFGSGGTCGSGDGRKSGDAVVLHSWHSRERVLDSGGFESTQRVLASEPVVECSESGARWLGIAYWQAVNRVTRGGRARPLDERWRPPHPAGRREPPRPSGRPSSHSPATPSRVGTRSREAYSPCGRAGRSHSRSERADDEVELSVFVEEYLPRLAARLGAPRWTGALYAKGQSPLHAAVSRRYFELLASRAGV